MCSSSLWVVPPGFHPEKVFGGWGGGTAQHEAPYDFLEGVAHAHC